MQFFAVLFFLLAQTALGAIEIAGVEVWGKVELSGAYVHLDIIEANKTVSKKDLPAVRSDAVIIIGQGWNIRPTVMWGRYKTEFFTAGIGFGRCIPVKDWLIFTPLVGVNYSQVLTSVHLDLPVVGSTKFREKFEATAPWVGLETTYVINTCWRVTGVAQYAWSRSHTKLGDLHFNDDSKGPNFGVQLEHDLSKKWSINLGAGWNLSLSRDSNGIRARGAKIGLARWF